VYEYKSFSFLAAVSGRDRKSADDAASQLTALINAKAVNGWEFYQLAPVNVEVRPGCLGAFLGGRAGTLQVDQVILRRGTPD
jgi:hypothetical protein